MEHVPTLTPKEAPQQVTLVTKYIGRSQDGANRILAQIRCAEVHDCSTTVPFRMGVDGCGQTCVVC